MIQRLYWVTAVRVLSHKDFLCECRGGYQAVTLFMFTIIVSATLGLGLTEHPMSGHMAATLYWLVILLASLSGQAQSFIHERERGTLLALRVYAAPQAVLFAKIGFFAILLSCVCAVVAGIFAVFFLAEPADWFWFGGVLAIGIIGLSAVGTLASAMLAQISGRTALLPVLALPLLLPLFLLLVQLTANLFDRKPLKLDEFCAGAAFDAAVLAGASVLFDYLWEE